MLEKLNWFHLTGLITLVTSAIDVKMDGSVTAEIISIAKSASKKIGTLICSMKFLSPEFALYLYESNI